MSVQVVHRKLGQWSVQLAPDAPPSVVEALTPFGHVAVVPGRVSPAEHGDDLLGMARYVGVLRSVEVADQVALSGVGLAAWLGDEDGKGDVLETPGVTLTGVSFVAAVRALLPPNGAITEGTLYSGVAGTYSGVHAYQTPRAAIDYVCDLMGGEWRVNNDGTLDAGPASSLFRTTPQCVIVRQGAGYDITLRALPGQLASSVDAKDYTTRVVLVAAALAGGTADASTVPYKDLHGNPVVVTRVVDEQDDTLVANAPARAAAALAKVNGLTRSVRLSVDEFDVAGDFAVGDVVWVYDPDAGIYDPATQVDFRGRLLQPAAVRVLGLTWPIEAGFTVAFRDSDGAWTDLTPWVSWEEGGGEVEVADALAPSLTGGFSSPATQVSGSGGGLGDTAVPGVPTFGAFTTTSYQPTDGLPRAAVTLTWAQPTNTDASTIVDGDHYDIRYRPTGTTGWQTALVPFSQTSTTISGLPPNTGYDWQIRCVDYATPVNEGAWSATTAFTTAQDATAPATPAAPTVAASTLSIQVSHSLGLAAGGTFNLPLDMSHLEVHASATTGFTASTATLRGKLTATVAEIGGGIPVVGTFGVADRAGNRSPASAQATATAVLVDSAHISDLVASKITAGTMSAAVILSGSIKTGTSGARVEIDASGVRAYDSAGFNTAELKADGTFTLNNGNTLNGILINNSGLEIYNGSGQVLVDLDAAGSFLMRSSLSGARVELDMSGLRLYNGGGTQTVSLDAATGNATFTGTVTGSTITGSTLQTAASGDRVQIGSGSGTGTIDFYSASGDHGYIRADTAGTNRLGIYSASGSEYIWLYNGTTSLNSSSGVISANSSGFTAQSTGGGGAYVTGNGGSLSMEAASGVNIGSSGSNVTIGYAFGGSTSIASVAIGIGNAGPATTGTALVRASGQLRPQSSSLRYKKDIEDVPQVLLEHLTALRPITYRDKHGLDDSGGVRRYFGLIAEEIADGPLDLLVLRDDEGRPESLMYDRLAALLVLGLRELADRVAALEAA